MPDRPDHEKAQEVSGMRKLILDACCGSRMFWYDKSHQDVLYMDQRDVSKVLCDGRKLEIHPDLLGDFRHLPFGDSMFRLVVFDPPHLIRAGEQSWIRAKYGVLDPETWQEDLKAGFSECWRVLSSGGVLLFKWSEDQISFRQVRKLFPARPLLGDKRGKTRWTFFWKGDTTK